MKSPCRRSILAAAIAQAFSIGAAQGNPTGPSVAAGAAAFSANGKTLTVTTAPGSIINWQSFSIAPGELTRFQQSSSLSAVLNRVVGRDPSAILGTLSSNGRVFLVNPNGIVFGAGARIDTAGLVASTLNISDRDFLAGNLRFEGGGLGVLRNEGSLRASGDIYLVGPQIENAGIIRSDAGSVLLTAGKSVTITSPDAQGVQFALRAPTDAALNLGTIEAKNAAAMFASTLRHSGEIRANRVTLSATGEAILEAGSAIAASGEGASVLVWSDERASVRGAISAKGADGKGGFVETSARTLDLNGARVDTGGGQWLIDPNDFTVAPSGGNMTGADVGAALATGNLTIATATMGTPGNGDINVNDAVSWSANTLTLNAERDINVNAVMTASGTSALAMNTGGLVKVGLGTGGFLGRVDFPGRAGTGFLTINGNDYTVIQTLGAEGSVSQEDLQGMKGRLGWNYALGGYIDATATSGWNGGAGFEPVGTDATPFTGQFNGLGHVISNLTINRGGQDNVGLFGKVYGYGAGLSNVGLSGGSVIGHQSVGGLVGQLWSAGFVTNSFNTGSVTAAWSWCCNGLNVGGLAGYGWDTPIYNSFASGNVTGYYYGVGGLLGSMEAGRALIANGFASGAVSAGEGGGGLVGYVISGGISGSYATGHVTVGGNWAGGLVGTLREGWIVDSYATGNASAGNYAGGLVGRSNSTRSYIGNSYAAGAVTSGAAAGGLIGHYELGTTVNSFWDVETTGQATSPGGGTGLTTAQMKTASNFTGAGWDPAVWRMADGAYPTLKAFERCAYTACWMAQGGGDWSQPANWFGSHIPVSGDSVYLNAPGLATITYTGASTPLLSSLISNENLTVNSPGGGLEISGSTTFNTGTTFTVAGGTVNLHGPTSVPTLKLQGGSMSATGSVNAGVFEMSGGTWSQVSAAPPAFNANDFRISGGTFIRAIGGDGSAGSPYQLTDIYGVQGMGSSGMLANSYALSSNVDATGTAAWNAGAGFAPIAGAGTGTRFTGHFDGLGHTIANLTIYRPGVDSVGMFGDIGGGATVANVGLVGGSVAGRSTVGGLVGVNWGGTISNSYNTGSVASPWSDCCNGIWVGGLVGVSNGTIENSYATGNVTGYYHTFGGLVGSASGVIRNSYATGNVTADYNVGGLIGNGSDLLITGSYASGNATANVQQAGGLASSIINTTVVNSYATGSVTSGAMVGGLVGKNDGGIYDSYATGRVTGGSAVGGLVGGTERNWGTVTNSFWDTETTGQATSYNGGTGLLTAQMKTAATFNAAGANWDPAVWRMVDGTYPTLSAFSPAPACAYGACWIGTASGDWNIATNWFGNHVPTTGNSVFIDAPGLLTITYSGASTATLGSLVSNENLTLNSSGGGIAVTGGTTFGSGTTFTLANGTATFNGATALQSLDLQGGTFTGSGAVTINGPSVAWSGGTLGGSGALSIPGGTINAAGSGARILNGRTLSLGGFTLPGGSLDVQSGALNTTALTTVSAGATLIASGGVISSTVPMSIAGTLRTGAGSVTAPGIDITPTGTLTGAGTVVAANVNNAGTVAPGNSPGTLTVSGDYAQLASGTLATEITGPAAGQCDVLAVSGAATLNGAVNFTGAGANGTFPFLTAASISGSFANRTGTLRPTLAYNAGSVTATLGSPAAPPASSAVSALPANGVVNAPPANAVVVANDQFLASVNQAGPVVDEARKGATLVCE